jgi:acyl dehydratase
MAVVTKDQADPTTTGEVIELDESPSLAGLYARAASPLSGGGGRGGGDGQRGLPTQHLVLRDIDLDRDHVAAYADVCGFTLTDALPQTYLHIHAFPLHIQLMGRDEFPFPMLGMVHLRQRIEVLRPVTADEVVDVEVWLEGLRPHGKGSQFTVRSQVRDAAGEVVWDGTSTYLARHSQDAEPPSEDHPADAVEIGELPRTADWRIEADQGRRYGRVSGDVNPIHMSALSAKAFGFPRAIAHGMWTMARAVAALEGRLPGAVDIDVAFKTPLLIPGRVTYATQQHDDAWHFAVRNDRNGKPHLAGIATAAS